jgi:hypothetical protein
VSYDVAVRHLALVLLLMSGFLLAPDLPRMMDVLVLNRPVESRPARPLFPRKWLERAVLGLTITLGCYWFGSDLVRERRNSKASLEAQFKTPYYGVWTVDEFAVNGADRPALFTDPLRWKLIVFDWSPSDAKPSVVVHFGLDTRRLFFMEFDDRRKSITLIQSKPDRLMAPQAQNLAPVAPKVGSLTVNDAQPGQLVLEGDFEGQRVRAVLHRTMPAPIVRKWRYRWFHTGPFWGDDIII